MVATVHGHLPGLLVEWRRPTGVEEWEALVVHQVRRGGAWVTLRSWVPARWLQQLEVKSQASG